MEVVAERMFKNITEQREWNANVARQISIKPRVKVKRKGITTGRSLSQQLIERTNSHGRCYTTQVKSAEDQPRSGVELESFLISRGRDCIVLAVECRALVCQV